MTGRQEGAPSPGRPGSLPDLIAALTALDSLPVIDRARAIPDLISAAKTVLAAERGAAMVQATTGPDRISIAELARRLGIHRSKADDAIAAAQRRTRPDTGTR